MHTEITEMNTTLSNDIASIEKQMKEIDEQHKKEKEDLSSYINTQLEILTKGLEKETAERSSAEEEIVATVEKVFGGFQEGLTAFQS